MGYPLGYNHTQMYTHMCIYKYEVGMKQFGGGAKLDTIL